MRLAPLLLVPLLLASCARERAVERPAPGPVSRPAAPRPSPATQQCLGTLVTAGVRFEALPDRSFGGGCGLSGTVKLLDIGTPVTNLGALTCPLAGAFAAWTRYAVQPAATIAFGRPVAKIESFGTYSCRAVAGSDRLSEHGRANAVDVAAFVLDDGRRVTVRDDWNGADDARRFLRLIHDSACRRFGTVLSPDYNAAHADHLHLDMAPGHFCR